MELPRLPGKESDESDESDGASYSVGVLLQSHVHGANTLCFRNLAFDGTGTIQDVDLDATETLPWL